MGKFHESILPAHQDFIKKQHLFFVCTAPLDANGHINISPKNVLASINYNLTLASHEVKEQVQTLNEEINQDFGVLLSAKENRLSQLKAALSTAQSYNNSLGTANTQEQARKTINAIQVSRSMGNTLSEAQYQSLLSIASQSEEAVGYAKSEAISQLGPCDQNAFFSDMNEGEGEDRSSNPTISAGKNLYRVFPNPGAGLFHIDVPMGTIGLLRITDHMGRTIQTLNLNAGPNDPAINLSAYPIGLYGFSFFDASGKLLETIKVSVHR